MAARSAGVWIALAVTCLRDAETARNYGRNPRPHLNRAVAAIRMAQLILDGKTPEYAEEVWQASGND